MRAIRLSAILFAALPVAVAVACNDDPEAACTVDTDCPIGTICREGRCGPVGADAAPPPAQDAAPTPACATDGTACTVNDDCCSRSCTNGLCGSAITQPVCRNLYELCQGDCCAGLTCTAGACR